MPGLLGKLCDLSFKGKHGWKVEKIAIFAVIMTLTAIAVIFVLGYLAIALEHHTKVNKAASALFLGAALWLVWFRDQGSEYGEGLEHVSHQLFDTFGDLSQILFFLMGAMTIVAIIDANDGFSIITSRIKTDNTKILMWVISWISFF
ncbi:MAG: hypothetical protein LBQ76_07025, partial [Candidatus Fibromonas sp.]|nr:hypothetical protein [Candidatus Fibromonas sp.]